MKTLALLCVVGLVAARDSFSGRIAIYGELTLKLLATGMLAAWSRVVDCRQWPTQEFWWGGGGVQQIQLRTVGRENGDLGAVAPSQGFWRQL